MSLKPNPKLLAGLAGGGCLFVAVRALSTGVINLGGGRVADNYVTWADDPGLFALGIGFALLMTAICAAYLWRHRDD